MHKLAELLYGQNSETCILQKRYVMLSSELVL